MTKYDWHVRTRNIDFYHISITKTLTNYPIRSIYWRLLISFYRWNWFWCWCNLTCCVSSVVQNIAFHIALLNYLSDTPDKDFLGPVPFYQQLSSTNNCIYIWYLCKNSSIWWISRQGITLKKILIWSIGYPLLFISYTTYGMWSNTHVNTSMGFSLYHQNLKTEMINCIHLWLWLTLTTVARRRSNIIFAIQPKLLQQRGCKWHSALMASCSTTSAAETW